MVHLVLIIKVLLEVSIVILVYLVIALVGVFVADKLQICYKNWKYKKRIQQMEKDYKELLQRWCEGEQRRKEQECLKKLHKKEREKYPLFFLKEGIV